MIGKHVWWVFRKEMLDILRDRKTWVGTFLIPLLVIPLVFFLLGSSINRVQEEAREYIPLAVVGDAAHPLVRQVLQTPGAELVRTEHPLDALREGRVRAVFELPPDADSRMASGETVQIRVWYDASNQKSVYARRMIEEAAAAYGQSVLEERLRAVGLSPESIQPIVVRAENAVPEERVSGGMLSSIIPLMLILSLASGGMPAATDLVAGERERGTLEPLLLTPVSSASILTAKLFAVMAMNLTSGLASMIGLTVTLMAINPGEVSVGFFNAASMGVLLLMAMLLSALFGGVQLAISTAARTFKEAQLYMTPLVLVVMVPSYTLMPLHPTDIPASYFALPVYNAASVLKEVFYAELSAAHVATAVVSSLAYIAAAIALAAWLFRQERLLFR